MRSRVELIEAFKDEHSDVFDFVDTFFKYASEYTLSRFTRWFLAYEIDVDREAFVWDVANCFLDFLKFYKIENNDYRKEIMLFIENIENRSDYIYTPVTESQQKAYDLVFDKDGDFSYSDLGYILTVIRDNSINVPCNHYIDTLINLLWEKNKS